MGVPLGERSTPGWIARPVASLVEGLWRLTGASKAPPMTSCAVAMMSRTVTVDTRRARDELGWAPVRTVDEGIAAMRR